jgi:predicted nuclease with RNAse H fold
MPEATTAPAATAAPLPASTPAAPAPLKVSLIESILASNRANAIMDPTKPPEAPKVEPAKVEPKAADPKDLALKRLTQLEKQNLDYKARITELETSQADYAALKEVEKVFATGTATEKIEALGKLAKADPTDTMEDLLAEHLSKPTAATKNALETKVDELTKKIEDDEKARKALDSKTVADAAAAAAAAEQAGTAAFAVNALETATNEDGTPKYELCSRADNREDATTLAIERVKVLAIERAIDGDTLTPDIARQLFQDAYADVEGVLEETAAEELAAWEQKYKRTPKTAPAPGKGPPPQQLQAPTAPPASAGKEEGRKEPQTRPPTLAKPPVVSTKPTGSLMDQILQSNRDRAVY